MHVARECSKHCINIQIWSFLWSIFSRFQTEYGNLPVFGLNTGKYGPEENYVFWYFPSHDQVEKFKVVSLELLYIPVERFFYELSKNFMCSWSISSKSRMSPNFLTSHFLCLKTAVTICVNLRYLPPIALKILKVKVLRNSCFW